MKYLKFIFYFIPLLLVFIACNQEDDICTEGGTPRMKVKFKKNGKLCKIDSLTVQIVSNKDTLMIIDNKKNLDSIMVPLKVNGDGFTDVLVNINSAKTSPQSNVKIKYNEISEYVSPGCGIRKLYNDVSAEVIKTNPVKSVELKTNQIHNENQTILYFNF